MPISIVLIFLIVVLGISLVAIGAYFLQQWLILRRFPPKPSAANPGGELAEFLYYEEKLKANYGDELPTTRIRIMLSIPNSQDKILLLDYANPFPNVLRCHSNGWIVWRAALPTSTNDAYTHVEWQGQGLKAFSESCYLATLDPENGEIISYEFTSEFPRILQ